MNQLGTILTVLLALYALGTGVFLVWRTDGPQATLAWMLVFIFAPEIGLLVYLLFGRDVKAFSKQSQLLRQDLEGNALPILSPMLSRQDAERPAAADLLVRCGFSRSVSSTDPQQ
jgi:cardiolipin synthase